METADTVLNYFGVFGFAALTFAISVFVMRAKWQREADDHVQIRVVPRAGKSYTVLGKISGKVVILEPNEKRNRPGKEYPIDETATYEADYPSNFPMSFMRTNIKEMLVYAWNWEPISRTSDELLMSPDLSYNLEHEKFTTLFLATSQIMADYEEKLQKALSRSVNPMMVYALLILAVVGTGYLIMLLQPVLPELEGLADMKKALGL